MTTDTRPNVLFIAIDDMNHWPRCMGKYPSARTPHIDRLAQRGTLFTNAFCPAPICVPGRTGVLSGLMPSRSGCYVNTSVANDAKDTMHSQALEEALPLPVHFRRNGYHTMGSGKIFHGKWHSREQGEDPLWEESNPREWFEGIQRDFELSPSPRSSIEGLDSPRSRLYWGPTDDSKGLVDDVVTQWCSRKLQQSYDTPFLLGAGFIRTHTPLIAPRRFFDLYDPERIEVPEVDEEAFAGLCDFAKTIALGSGGHETVGGNDHQLRTRRTLRGMVHAYLACISYVDHCIGRLIDTLDASPHADNTIVALWVDHGWNLGNRHHTQKWGLWATEANVPLIISRPAGRTGLCETPVSTLDLYPTLSELCRLPARSHWQGHSLKPLLEVPQGDWPHPAITTYGPGNHAVRTREGTYIRYADGQEELYDPEADPNESRNLAGDPGRQEIKQRLAGFLPEEEVMPLHWAGLDPREAVANMKDGDEVPLGCHLDGIAGRSIRICAKARIEGSEAVLVSLHGVSAGFALYVKQGQLCFAMRDVPRPIRWEAFSPETQVVRAQAPLHHGEHEIEATVSLDGTVTLTLDAEQVASGKVAGPLSHQPISLVTAGHFRTSLEQPEIAPGDFAHLEHFPGWLQRVSIRFGQS